jgi:hypothetical protein
MLHSPVYFGARSVTRSSNGSSTKLFETRPPDNIESRYFRVTSVPSEGLEEIDELPQNPPSLRVAYRQAIRAMDVNAQLAAAAMFRRALQVITRDILAP